MGRHGEYTALRLELDDAITYGTKRRALQLARSGRDRARKEGFPAEEAYFRGQIELIREHYAGAMEYFDSAIAQNPFDGAAFNDRALCLAELGALDQALEYFDRGIEAEPDFATIYHNKGWLLNNLGRHREALGCFFKALSLDPVRPVTYDNLADAYFNVGDIPAAVRAYRMVLELLPAGCCPQVRRGVRVRLRELRAGTE
jgi:tetratricopeptide (TPR) repeat protein